MKLSIALVVAAFAASAYALPAPSVTRSVAKLAVRSPADQDATGKTEVKAKCWSGCGNTSPFQLDQSINWGTSNLVHGGQIYQNFGQFQTGFQNFVGICGNSINLWQSQTFQAQQFAIQFRSMLSNFYYMLAQFSNGCGVCGPTVQGWQFQQTLVTFFSQIQTILGFIQSRYYSQIGVFQDDFQMLSACIQVLVGISQTVRIDLNTIFSGLNLNTFNSFGIPVTQYQAYSTPTLFNSITSVSSYAQTQTQTNGWVGGNSW